MSQRRPPRQPASPPSLVRAGLALVAARVPARVPARGTFALALALLCSTGPALAQRSLGRLLVEAPREEEQAAAEAESEAVGFLTVVPVRTPGARSSSVADLVEREAGLRVRWSGGLGSFTSVSLRGSDATEVAVFVDGVPLNRASSSAVDLSQIPADAVERIEIHRGMAPIELGGQGLGGAIHIITRKGSRAPSLRGSAGVGSFGARSASLGYGSGGKRLHVDASLAYHGATGDYSYFDYNGTPLTPGDDRYTVRRNNGFDQVAADVGMGGETSAAGRFDLGVHGFLKRQGVPGLGSEGLETREASLATSRLLVDGAVERRGLGEGIADLRVAAHLLFERSAFNNRAGERAGSFRPSRTDGQTLAGGIDGRLRIAASTSELFTVLGSLSLERFTPYDLLLPEQAPPPSTRLRAALVFGDEIRLWDDRVALAPALRMEAISSEVGGTLSTIGPQALGSDRVEGFVLPQLGVRVKATEWLVLKGSVGRTVRVPTTFELFGDGAWFLGRPSLRSETSNGGDVGLSVEGRAGRISGAVEADFFGRDVSDFIGVVRSGNTLSAANVGDRRYLGCEARARGRLGDLLAFGAGYTFLHGITSAEDAVPGAAGRAIPNVPAHKLDGRADLTLGPAALFYEIAWTSDVWLDPRNAGDQKVPGRVLHALGGRVGPWRSVPFALSVEVRNLADLRVLSRELGGVNAGRSSPVPLADFYDYPLPGRSVFVTVAYRP